MQAIILAGGFGTRLKQVISDVPKPMAPIRGRPFLAYLIEYLAVFGVDEIMLSIHHQKDVITDYFKNSYHGISIKYADEDQPLGTGGAIKYSLQKLNSNKPVLVLNGDTFLKMNFKEIYQIHKGKLTIALRAVEDTSRYGCVESKDGIVTSFGEKGKSGQGYINAGVYVVSPDIFDGADLGEKFSFETDFIEKNIKTINAQSFLSNDYFIDIGVPADYARAQSEIPELMVSQNV
ncbi:nucleotidyltransferase family protein [Rickettsiales bacterium]|nr:nucleotidyltransferase family protein [Rickettsiales bacterium]